MRRTLLGFLFILIYSLQLSAADIYYGNAAAGSNNGTSCGNAYAWNDGANGISVAAKQVAGNTLHACGTITVPFNTRFLTCNADGSSGSPVTVKWEAGSIVQSPAFPSDGGIVCSGRQWWTFDGSGSATGRYGAGSGGGTYRTTDNGNNGQGHNQQTIMFEFANSSNITVKNLTSPMTYDQMPNSVYASCSDRVDSEFVSIDGGSHYTVTHNTVDHVRIGVGFGDGGVGGTDYNGTANELTTEVAVALSSGALPHTAFRVAYNHFIGAGAVWDTNLNCYHHEALHAFGSGSAYPDQIYVNHNLLDGNWGELLTGTHITAGFFTEFVGPTVDYWDNIVDFSGSTAQPNNGLEFCKGDGGGSNNHCKVYNETHVTITPNGSTYQAQAGASQQDFINVITRGPDGPDAGGDTLWATKPDYNWYYQVAEWQGFRDFAQWQAYGADAHGFNGTNPNINATTYVPDFGSGVIGAAQNLTSLCSGELTSLCTDFYDVARPGGAVAWDIGAVQFASVPTPVAPKGLRVISIQ